jgi:ABC-type dipeptide/oligopeptide/nickel transport system permease subunit
MRTMWMLTVPVLMVLIISMMFCECSDGLRCI